MLVSVGVFLLGVFFFFLGGGVFFFFFLGGGVVAGHGRGFVCSVGLC
ncbi:hypothetical protein [Stenotrophomonas maltophilia]